MGILSNVILDQLTRAGPRLGWLTNWLDQEVWSVTNYQNKAPADYLQSGERLVNELEEVIAAAAPRIYDELLEPIPAERHLKRFLTDGRPCAAVVFDGLSLREIPLVLKLAEQSGLRVVEQSFARAATPSETIDFVAERLGVASIGPSALPGRADLRNEGIACYYFDQVNQQRLLDAAQPALLLWSSFPDYTYSDQNARLVDLFVHLQNMMMTAWQNTVQQVLLQARGRRILITSDHGYVFFGNGCNFPWDNNAIRPLTHYLGGQRYARTDERPNPPDHRGLYVFSDRPLAMIRGRVQTHPSGDSASKLYKHGGLSLMEMLTPWIVLESA